VCSSDLVLSVSLLSSDVKNSEYDTEKDAINFLCKAQDALKLFTSLLKAQL
jgi:hypothetical protein